VADDAKMGMPAKLNANGCFNFLNSLTALDHTRLVVSELEGFYMTQAVSGKFHRWVALLLWSIFRASDQYEQLHSGDAKINTPQLKNQYSFVLPPEDFNEVEVAQLRQMIQVLQLLHLHELLVGSDTCGNFSFSPNVVLFVQTNRKRQPKS